MKFTEIFTRSKKTDPGKVDYIPNQDLVAIALGRSTYNSDYAMKLSAVYRAVNCISDSIAQLPLEIFKVDGKGYKIKDRQNNLFSVLNQKPNIRMNRYTFISLIIQSMLLKGNGYAYIKRGINQQPEQLIFLPYNYVSIIPPTTLFEPIKYKVLGIDGDVLPKDILHFINHSYDGVVGVSTLHYAFNSLGLYHDAEKYASNFFAGGCALGGFIKAETSLTPKQKQEIKEGFGNAFGRSGVSNGLAVLEGNLSYEAITVNPQDSQMLQNREFSIIDVARWFGVSPIKLMDLSKSSYSTVEATQLAFLTDTIAPLLEKIELEFETKLFPLGEVDVRFDVSQLLRADRQSLANYYSTLVQNGVMQINEVRRELDLPSVADGDTNFVPVNLQTLEKATSPDPETSQDIKEKLNNNV